MNETKNHPPTMVIEQTMIIPQAAAEVAHLANKALWRFIAMMNMDFDIADPLACHFCEWFKQLGVILLLRIEEAVAWTISLSIPGSRISDTWPGLLPPRHPAKRHIHRDLLAKRLVVIRDCNPQPAGFRPMYQASCSIAEVPWKPKLCVAGKVHYDSAR